MTSTEHPVSEEVKWCFKRKTITKNGRAVKGLTKVLPVAFEFRSGRSTPKFGVTESAFYSGKVAIKGGPAVGRAMDKLLTDTVKLMRKYKLSAECFFDPKCCQAAMKRVTRKIDREKLAKLVLPVKRQGSHAGTVALYGRQFWREMYKLELFPVATQVPVCHQTLRLGTLVDVVAYSRKTKNFRLIEVKTGYDKCYRKHNNKKVKAPFQAQTDSAYNQHQLQLAFTHVMYRHTYPTKRLDSPLLLRFFASDQPDRIGLQKWAIDGVMGGAVQAMKEHTG